MRPYSVDLRERVVAALDAGMSSPKVAAQFLVSGSFVRKLRIRRAELGHIEWFAPPGRKRLLSEEDEARFRRLVLAHADATLAELREYTRSELGVALSRACMSRTLQRMGLTRKKSPSGRPKWTELTSKRNAVASGG
jgi:transposase